MNDFKFALRQLPKNAGLTAVAVLTLTMGVGSTTAFFKVDGMGCTHPRGEGPSQGGASV